jgi:hypothetical protein
MLPNSLHPPYLPINLVFYVDSSTGFLVKPYKHYQEVTNKSIFITSENTNQTLSTVYLFDPTCIGSHLSTESDINTLVKGWISESDSDSFLAFSFSKYPDYYYKYINFANEITYIRLTPSEYEECYEVCPPYIDLSNYELKNHKSYIEVYEAKVSTNTDIPTILDLGLSEKCTVISQDSVIYLYIDKVYCGYKLVDVDHWVFIENSLILTNDYAQDFNTLIIKGQKTWEQKPYADPKQISNQFKLSLIKQYLFNILSCM